MKLRLIEHGAVTDRHGRETFVSVLTADGVPVAVLHSSDRSVSYNDDGIHQEHVIQGIQMRYSTEKYWHEDRVDSSCPSRSRMTVPVESKDSLLPGDVDIARMVREDYEEDEGFSFVKWGERGTEIPKDASDAFLRGVERAKKRYSRIIRNGKLTGEARSY
jgi:hypothetical protein